MYHLFILLMNKNKSSYCKTNRINIYVCILNIQVPHEVKNQSALAKRTSKIMKNGQDVIIQNGKWY